MFSELDLHFRIDSAADIFSACLFASVVLFLLLAAVVFKHGHTKIATALVISLLGDAYFHAKREQNGASIVVHAVVRPFLVLAVGGGLRFMFSKRPFSHGPVALLAALGMCWTASDEFGFSALTASDPQPPPHIVWDFEYDHFNMPGRAQRHFRTAHILSHICESVFLLLLAQCAKLHPASS